MGRRLRRAGQHRGAGGSVAALGANPRARAMFETLTGANRYAILYRVGNAKKPETRSRRIDQFVEMLARVRPSTPRLHDRRHARRPPTVAGGG